MIADDELEDGLSTSTSAPVKRRRPKKHVRDGQRKYVSKHFLVDDSRIATPPATPQKPCIIAGLNVDELSSDSSLTDVPSDIGPDPFIDAEESLNSKPTKVKRPKKSPYFPNKPRPNFISCLPFPPLSTPKFGLMQERFADDPFRLLIATIFLNRTRGEQAMPVFFQLMKQYPTVADLAAADVQDVVEIIRRLGFQNQRARKCIEMAKAWLKAAPAKGKRYRKLNYPLKGDGRDIEMDATVEDEDTRVAWEIAYLPGLGPYSHDSWRIFCRDELRGLSESWKGEGAADGFEPEWKRVLPTDKELRAYLTWMWLKEGWVWNKETGQRTKAEDELLEKARRGGIVQEEQEKDHLVLTSTTALNVEKPAGSFLPT
jgi:endonuclease III